MTKSEIHKSSRLRLSNAFVDLDNRYPYLALLLLLLFALVLRISALASLRSSVYIDYLLWDERIYHTWAKKIADGTFNSSSVYEFSPLPAYVMALVYRIFSADFFYIRILNVFWGTFTCFIIYLIGKTIAGRSVGLLSCLIASLYEPLIFYSIVPLKTSLSVFLFSTSVYFSISILKAFSLSKTFFLGVVCGLALNMRGNFIVVIPLVISAVIWWLLKDKVSRKAIAACFIIFVIGLAGSMSPFIIRNYRASGDFALTTSQAGMNLYFGNNLVNKDPYYRPLPFASPSPFHQGVQFTIEASRRSKRKLSPQEASSFWTKEVIRTAVEQPAAFTWKMFQKLLVLVNRFEAGDHYHIGFVSQFVEFFRLPLINLWLVLPFGLAVLVTRFNKSRELTAASLVCLLYGLTLVLFYSNTRYRLPLLTILIPFSAVGAKHIFCLIHRKRKKEVFVYFSIVLIFSAVEFLPVRGTGDLTAYYNTHAVVLSSKGMENEAIGYWKQSSNMNGAFSPFANLELGRRYLRKGDIPKAIEHRNKISDDSFAAADKYNLTGDIFRAVGQMQDALSAYKKSIDINFGHITTRKRLVEIGLEEGNQGDLKDLSDIRSFYNLF